MGKRKKVFVFVARLVAIRIALEVARKEEGQGGRMAVYDKRVAHRVKERDHGSARKRRK